MISAYLPPDFRKQAALDDLDHLIKTINLSYSNPLIIVGGDFNMDLRKNKILKDLHLSDGSAEISTWLGGTWIDPQTN